MGDTIVSGIGQGFIQVTPLQLATYVARVATGRAVQPHVTRSVAGVAQPGADPLDWPLLGLTDRWLALVRDGMWAVVNEGGGTGAAARCPGIEISGKTGTAQVVSQTLQQSAKSSEYKNTAWFVGYAPREKPEIAVAALVQRGEHSYVAVPIVRDVIKAYFDKKLGSKPPENQMEAAAKVLSQLQPTPLPRPSRPASRQ